MIILLQERYQVVDIDKLLFVVNFWACRHGELTTAAVKYDEYCAKYQILMKYSNNAKLGRTETALEQ